MATATLYHGTSSDFDAFEFGRESEVPSAGAVWFSADRRHAESYARARTGSDEPRVIVAKVTTRRVFNTRKVGCQRLFDRWCAERLSAGDDVATGYNYVLRETCEAGYDMDGHPHYENNEWLANKVREAGYDAMMTSDGNGQIGLGVWTPEQIAILRSEAI